MQNRIEFLKAIDFLSRAQPELLECIDGSLDVIDMAKGAEIFAGGAAGDAMYFIQCGEVQLQ